jgi:hypothetical protein
MFSGTTEPSGSGNCTVHILNLVFQISWEKMLERGEDVTLSLLCSATACILLVKLFFIYII